MNEQDTPHPGTEVTPSEGHGTAVRLDEGHVVGTGGLPDRFTNPGLPHHVPRMADKDERAAKRAEKQVATLFGISILGTLLFIVLYFAIDIEQTVFIPGVGTTSASNFALGITLAMSLLGIGLGAVHWAKTLMPDDEVVEERHPMRASDESRQRVIDEMAGGGKSSQITRRPLIKYTLGGALLPSTDPAICLRLRGDGPCRLAADPWRRPYRHLLGRRRHGRGTVHGHSRGRQHRNGSCLETQAGNGGG